MKKIIISIILIILIVFSFNYYTKYQRSRSYVKNYYLSCLSQVKAHVADIEHILNGDKITPGGLEDKDYEKYYLMAENFSDISDYISLLNAYFTSINNTRTAYFGRTSTCRIFDYYNLILTHWAFAIKDKKIKEMPSKAEIQGLKEDVYKLTKLFQVYVGSDNKDYEKVEDMDYKRFEKKLKNFSENSGLPEIREASKQIFPQTRW